MSCFWFLGNAFQAHRLLPYIVSVPGATVAAMSRVKSQDTGTCRRDDPVDNNCLRKRKQRPHFEHRIISELYSTVK